MNGISPHGGCTIELMERAGEVGLFECGECGEQYEMAIDENGELVAEGTERSDPSRSSHPVCISVEEETTGEEPVG